MIKLKCLYCQNNLTGQKIKYCSYECQSKYSVDKYRVRRQEKRALNNTKKCGICNSLVPQGNRKFCSFDCYKKNHIRSSKSYACQLLRAKNRKLKLINLLGGICEHCGYCKNYAALAFHHKDPKTKSFNVDSRQCSNRSWKVLVEEVRKCSLLCMNCHCELHWPHCQIGADEIEPSTSEL